MNNILTLNTKSLYKRLHRFLHKKKCSTLKDMYIFNFGTNNFGTNDSYTIDDVKNMLEKKELYVLFVSNKKFESVYKWYSKYHTINNTYDISMNNDKNSIEKIIKNITIVLKKSGLDFFDTNIVLGKNYILINITYRLIDNHQEYYSTEYSNLMDFDTYIEMYSDFADCNSHIDGIKYLVNINSKNDIYLNHFKNTYNELYDNYYYVIP